MVLYYSATGNTEFIAKLLAKRLDDTCMDLLPRIREHDYSGIHSEKPFVVCMPVYVCEPPKFVRTLLKKTPLTGNKDIYFVFTSGGYAGISNDIMRRIVRFKKMNYMGRRELKMPRNYVASNMYPELEKDEIRKRILDSGREIPGIAARIRAGKKLKDRYVFFLEKLITYPFTPVWTKFTQPVKKFYTTDKCVGCGLCSKRCPLNNIEMVNRKPVWKKPCAHCMSCIGNCPFEAIEYGNITQSKEKYRISKYVRKRFL